jgi:hypothetical protein
MKTDAARQSLQNALQEMRIAEDELNRPTEDAVTLCACNYTRNALNGFLRAFLLKHSVPVSTDLKSGELLNLCSGIDPQFSGINISRFICHHVNDETECEKMYCLSVEKVNECFRMARVAKELVLSKLNMSELDFE